MRDPFVGILPAGIGFVVLVIAHSIEGGPLFDSTRPVGLGDALGVAGIAILVAAFVCAIRPLHWILPTWYREAIEKTRDAPLYVLYEAERITRELDQVRAHVVDAMQLAAAERHDGRSTMWPAREAVGRAAVEASLMRDRYGVPEIAELVGNWRAVFESLPPQIDTPTTRRQDISDEDWDRLAVAADAAIECTTKLAGVIHGSLGV